MDAAVLALIAVVVGATIGAVGGFVTARQQGRQALALAVAQADQERERQLRQLAVEITQMELTRDPSNPYRAAEQGAVLMALLKDFEVDLADVNESVRRDTIPRFRKEVNRRCRYEDIDYFRSAY